MSLVHVTSDQNLGEFRNKENCPFPTTTKRTTSAQASLIGRVQGKETQQRMKSVVLCFLKYSNAIYMKKKLTSYVAKNVIIGTAKYALL